MSSLWASYQPGGPDHRFQDQRPPPCLPAPPCPDPTAHSDTTRMGERLESFFKLKTSGGQSWTSPGRWPHRRRSPVPSSPWCSEVCGPCRTPGRCSRHAARVFTQQEVEQKQSDELKECTTWMFCRCRVSGVTKTRELPKPGATNLHHLS